MTNFVKFLWALEACLYDCCAKGGNPLDCPERQLNVENCPIDWEDPTKEAP